jgi:outer membrane receptor protein involved in Fe transport
MKNIYLVFWLYGLLIPPVSGHNISIRGLVLDQSTNTPLPGATVQLLNTLQITTTNQLGIYTFADLPEGKYALKISFLGYEQNQLTVTVGNQQAAEVITRLESGTVELAEVSIAASPDKPLNLIPAVDLQLRPLQNAQEILRLIPGVVMAQHAGGGKAEQVFLRGFDIDHGTDIMLTVDGMPVNMVSHAHGQGYADLHFLIPETVQQVDFGKGPYRADKGNFATAGYAEFTTRRALEKNLVKLEAGTFHTWRGLGMFNLLGKKARQQQQNAYLASEYLFRQGYFDSPQHLRRLNLMGQYQGVFKQSTILHASLSAFRSSWDASGQIPQRAVRNGSIGRFGAIDDTEGGQTARYSGNMTLEKSFRHNTFLRHQAYFIRYDFELFSNFTFFLLDPVHGDQLRQRENRSLSGYQGSYQTESTMLGRPLRHELGLGGRYDRINGSELSHTLNRHTTLARIQEGKVRELNTFAYLHETWHITANLRVNAALRFDHLLFYYRGLLAADVPRARASSQQLSPKLNVTYAWSPRLQVYVHSGMGYHSNDSRVSAAGARGALAAARGLDVGLIFKPADRLLLQAALWRLDMSQELVYVGDAGVVEPRGKTRRYGLDLSLRAQLHEYVFADTDLNLARPRFRQAAREAGYIPLAPTLSCNGGLSYRRPQGLNASLRYRLLSARPANEANTLRAEGYLLADAVVSYTLKNFEWKLTGENLCNSPWKEAQFETESRLKEEQQAVTEIHFTPGTPFSLRAGVAYSF